MNKRHVIIREEPKKEESATLHSILGGTKNDSDEHDRVVQTFFESVWQLQPTLYTSSSWRESGAVSDNNVKNMEKQQDDNDNDDQNSKTNGKNNEKNDNSERKKNKHPSHHQNSPPFEALIDLGWNGCATLLYSSRHRFKDITDKQKQENYSQPLDPPLFFQNQTPLQLDTIQSTYSCNPLAAYLDGCSIVLNHAELTTAPPSSPSKAHHDDDDRGGDEETTKHLITDLCTDLQKSFMHVYANVYVTPPYSKAVPAHADDRDVLVLQIAGKKKWNVWKDVPIAYPYPNEQVGKSPKLPVPSSILSSPPLIQATLSPGDVLYMPRGYVHSASCYGINEGSFHITIAIPTHDWTYGKLMQDMIKSVLDSEKMVKMRMSVGRTLGLKRCHSQHVQQDEDEPKRKRLKTNDDEEEKEKDKHEETRNEIEKDRMLLETNLDQAFQILQQTITPSAVTNHLQNKIEVHNQHYFNIRRRRSMLKQRSKRHLFGVDSSSGPVVEKEEQVKNCKETKTNANKNMELIVGPLAAEKLRMNTSIRAATTEEREWVLLQEEKKSSIGTKTGDNGDDVTTMKQENKRGLTVRDETADALLSILSHLRNHPQLSLSVGEGFCSLINREGTTTDDDHSGDETCKDKGGEYDDCDDEDDGEFIDVTKMNIQSKDLCDDLSLLCFARCCVELGAMAIDCV